ncbi:hypothetical protein Q2490_10745 [Myroides odoratimimus]|uniref:hypothetical protein n=1 Tax=Myroides odoratimimus TaxID=76832 RepID=UPI0026DFAF60|nr:hypothetical protein [Myroides odoratimimus]MDO5857763.1 hypothetical protein [Myroides odoratimimus]
MKTNLSIIFILLFSISFGQGIPEPGVNLRDNGEYNDAINYYLNLKKEGNWDWGYKYNYTKVLALAGKIDSCFYYLNENIEEKISKQSLTDVEFIEIKNDKRWAIYEENVIKKHLPSNDLTLSAQIYRIIALSEKDKSNINLIIDLINKEGWPKISQVGDASNAIFAYFGYKDSFLLKFKKDINKLKKLCLKGEINCEYFAEIYDRIQKNSNKPQKYGTIFDIDFRNNRKKIYYNIIDENKINLWRSEIGLNQLEEYSQHHK